MSLLLCSLVAVINNIARERMCLNLFVRASKLIYFHARPRILSTLPHKCIYYYIRLTLILSLRQLLRFPHVQVKQDPVRRGMNAQQVATAMQHAEAERVLVGWKSTAALKGSKALERQVRNK